MTVGSSRPRFGPSDRARTLWCRRRPVSMQRFGVPAHGLAAVPVRIVDRDTRRWVTRGPRRFDPRCVVGCLTCRSTRIGRRATSAIQGHSALRLSHVPWSAGRVSSQRQTGEGEAEPNEFDPWMNAPLDVIPSALDVTALLSSTPQLAIAVTRVDVYPEGADIRVECRLRRRGEGDDEWWDLVRKFSGTSTIGTDNGPKFAVILAGDNRVAADSGLHARLSISEGPVGHSLMRIPNGASGQPWNAESGFGLWLWPLPPGPSLSLEVTWQEFGIDTVAIDLDTQTMLARAKRAIAFWDRRGLPEAGP